ncbi:hypothetical protein ACIU1J_05405 [Azospirillum doebereinerae]|uniref:hypothetical protein n=1 Tax=Azospirillum doebereinerae TaxID=92933 RepID=UPI001EE5D47D|nr:hypothetical protein [Azospirillum doebereinerae]MCG5240853.1 hypothetical protein [Azospirillum doebereinerae]
MRDTSDIDGLASAMVRDGIQPDQARFWARRFRVVVERKLAAESDTKLAATLAGRIESEIFKRYTLFATAGGAPWDLYPIREHGQRLGELLQGVPEADAEGAMAPYLDPIKRDLMRRGFPEDDAEAWCEEIAGGSGMWMDGPPPAEWLIR